MASILTRQGSAAGTAPAPDGAHVAPDGAGRGQRRRGVAGQPLLACRSRSRRAAACTSMPPASTTTRSWRSRSTGQPWLRPSRSRYPPSEIYYFAPLDERVETYQQAVHAGAGPDGAGDARGAEAAGRPEDADGRRHARVPGVRRQGLLRARPRCRSSFTLDLTPLLRP